MVGGTVEIVGGRPLSGEISLPGDKSIAHRALMLGAVARGTTSIRGLPDGEDVGATVRCLRALGVAIEAEAGATRVEGTDWSLRPPAAPLDCGNSGTTMRLLCGLLAGIEGRVELGGDGSLERRPMGRVTGPLGRMGVEFDPPGARAPLGLRGARPPRGADHLLEIASAQVKTALLLAGLQATGRTRVRSPEATRDHGERLLARMGAPVREEGEGWLSVDGPRALSAVEVDLPGDPSSSAFFVVAACVVPDARIRLRRVGLNPGRVGFLDVLRRMGAPIEVDPAHSAEAEPWGEVRASFASLRGTRVEAREIPGLIDEIPALCVAAALARGRTTFEGAGELRVKESDRLAETAALVRAFGGRAAETADGIVVEGVSRLRGAAFDAGGDHRIAMAAAVAALAANGRSAVSGARAAAVSFPGFFDALAAAGADLSWREA